MLPTYFLPFILPWAINTFINIGFFFYIGYLLNEHNVFEKFNAKALLIVCLIIGLFCCFWGNKIHLSYIDFYYGNYIFMVLSGLFLSAFTICLSKVIDKCSVLEYIGRNTMGILIFHKLFVIIFQTKLGFMSKLLMDSNFLTEMAIAILVSIISILLSLIISWPIKKIAPFMLGENK